MASDVNPKVIFLLASWWGSSVAIRHMSPSFSA